MPQAASTTTAKARCSSPTTGHSSKNCWTRNYPRTYLAQVDGQITQEAVNQLKRGVTIKGYRTKPCQAEIVDAPENLWERVPPIRYRANIPTSWVRLTLIEGKNRQVRHMTAAVGFPTLRLIRVQIGKIALGELQPGEWRVVNEKVI